MQIGIYYIKCLSNNKMYIGSSIDIKARLTWHISHLKNNTHYNKDMQNDYNNCGVESFVFDVLELTSENELNEKEMYYINLYNVVQNGYNKIKSIGGRYKKTEKHKKNLSNKRNFTDEHKRNLSKAYKRNVIKDKNFYKCNTKKVQCIETGVIYNSITEASINTNKSYYSISYQINNISKRKYKTKGLHFVLYND